MTVTEETHSIVLLQLAWLMPKICFEDYLGSYKYKPVNDPQREDFVTVF
jgi:hypothetical protein